MSSISKKFASALAASLTLGAAAWSPTASACGMNDFLGAVCAVGFTFAPQGYAFTNGQLMSIAQNQALFALLGTTYGGNGVQTFALPDTRGRVIVGAGQGPGLSNYVQGEIGGSETMTLAVANLPPHSHSATTTATAYGTASNGNADGPGGNTWAAKPRGAQYSAVAPDVAMNAGNIVANTTIGNTGGGQPFYIVQPYVAMQYIIALQGIFPSRP